MLFDEVGYDPSMGLGAGAFHGNAGWHDLSPPPLPPPISSSAIFAHEFLAHPSGGRNGTEPVSTMDSTESSGAIIITAVRPSEPSDPLDGFGDVGGAQENEFSGIPADGAGGGWGDSEVLTVARDPSLPPLTPEQQAIVDKLVHRYSEWLGSLQGLPPGAFFTLPDGSIVTATTLIEIFSSIDFVLYPNGYDFKNGGNGAADPNGGDPVLRITIGQLDINMRASDSVAWYLTHELAHLTPAGQAMNNSMTQLNSDGGAQITSSEWSANEQFANSLGRAIAEATGYTFGEPFLQQGAPYGYGGTVSYNPGQ